MWHQYKAKGAFIWGDVNSERVKGKTIWGGKFGKKTSQESCQVLAPSINNLPLLWQGLLLSVHVLSQGALCLVQFGERSTEVPLEPEYPWTPSSEITLDFSWWSDSWKKSTNISWWSFNFSEKQKQLSSDKSHSNISKMIQGAEKLE